MSSSRPAAVVVAVNPVAVHPVAVGVAVNIIAVGDNIFVVGDSQPGEAAEVVRPEAKGSKLRSKRVSGKPLLFKQVKLGLCSLSSSRIYPISKRTSLSF